MQAVLEDILRWEHVLDEPPEALAAYGREVLDETRAAMEGIAAAAGYADAAAAVAAAQAITPTAAGLVDDYRRAVDEARAYVVEHDIAGLPEGEELEVVATPAFLRSLLPFAAYDAPGPFADRAARLLLRHAAAARTSTRRRYAPSCAGTPPPRCAPRECTRRTRATTCSS